MTEQNSPSRAYFLSMDGQGLARLLGGDRLPRDKFGREGATFPGPGHSPKDRSGEARIDPAQPDGIWVTTYSPRDTWQAVKDHVLQQACFAPWQPPASPRTHLRPAPPPKTVNDKPKGDTPSWLWNKSKSALGTSVQPYLHKVRGGLRPTDTVRFLPADPPRYPHPAMIVPIGRGFLEPEPGRIVMPADALVGVHLTYLLPDGSGKADAQPVRRRIGRNTSGNPIPLAPMNDTLGLAITEGIEDGLTIYWAGGPGSIGVWAAGGVTFMPALADSVPDYTDCVTVCAHPEPQAIEFAAKLVRRLLKRGIYAELQSTTDLPALPVEGKAAA